jgi:phosphomevalonate kinase
MIAGEYAVLYGSDAWCLAVDRYAVVEDADAPGGFTPPEAIAAWRRAVACGLLSSAPAPGAARFDLAHLGAAGGRKLGLGSSAAGCVAALGWAVAREQGPEEVARRRADIARCAREGHREAQGGGSGVDVLTSALGGLVRARFASGLDGEPAHARHAVPAGLRWRVFWSGAAVRTSEMIARVEALRASDAGEHRARIAAIAASTGAFGDAFDRSDAAGMVAALQSVGAGMAALGDAAGAPIVTPAMARLAARAAQLGAAVKPSGAGGGDVVVAFAQDELAMEALRAAAASEGFEEVELGADGAGVDAGDAGER